MRIYFFTAPFAYSDFPSGSKSRLYKFSLSLYHKKTPDIRIITSNM